MHEPDDPDHITFNYFVQSRWTWWTTFHFAHPNLITKPKPSFIVSFRLLVEEAYQRTNKQSQSVNASVLLTSTKVITSKVIIERLLPTPLE